MLQCEKSDSTPADIAGMDSISSAMQERWVYICYGKCKKVNGLLHHQNIPFRQNGSVRVNTLRQHRQRPPGASAKNISVRADWLRQSGRAPSEPSETPGWRITPRPASIPRVQLHITLRSLFRRFFSLCRSPILNKNSGVVANCDHTSEWVHCVHACIWIAMHKDPRNCADPRNLAKSE
jgi:hypothetical protein